MRAVGLKVLKDKLAQYVRMAAAGEVVLVTDRDQVVAELRPPSAGRSSILSDSLLAEAVRKGWIVPPTITSYEPPAGLPVAQTSELLAELSQDREDR